MVDHLKIGRGQCSYKYGKIPEAEKRGLHHMLLGRKIKYIITIDRPTKRPRLLTKLKIFPLSGNWGEFVDNRMLLFFVLNFKKHFKPSV